MCVQIEIEDITLARAELRIEYHIENRTDRDLYVFNRLADRFGQLGSPSSVPRPELAQTCVLHPATLCLVLGPVPSPRRSANTRYLAPTFPACSKLEAGRSLSARIRMIYPLCEWSEYVAPSRAGRATTITAVRIEANFIFADECRFADPHFESSQAWVVRGPIHDSSATRVLTDPEMVLKVHRR